MSHHPSGRCLQPWPPPNPYLHTPLPSWPLHWGVLPLSQTNKAKAELLLFPKLPHLDKQHYNVTSCSSKISRLAFIPPCPSGSIGPRVFFLQNILNLYSRLAISTSLPVWAIVSSAVGSRGRHASHSPPFSYSGFWTTYFLLGGSKWAHDPVTLISFLCLKLSNGVLLALRLIFNLIEKVLWGPIPTGPCDLTWAIIPSFPSPPTPWTSSHLKHTRSVDLHCLIRLPKRSAP